jgi:predicted nucleotidyltransferase
MVFHRVWDQVFSTWSHVAVLRALQDSAHGSTGREIARLAGMNHRSCLQALTELEALSLVRRVRGGRDHLFTLNREHLLVEEGIVPLLALERSFSRTLFSLLAKRLAKHATSVIVFGSVTRNEETPSSDLDLCLVLRAQKDKATVEAAVHSVAPELLRRYGARLAPFVLTRKEFVQKARRKLPPVHDIVKEGVVIAGVSLEGLLSGKE